LGSRIMGRSAAVVSLGVLALAMSAGHRAPAAAPEELEQRLNLGVVAIEATIGGDRVRSSGTVINAEQGLVITTAHTVWGATSLKVATALGILHGRLVARAPCDDLALVETQPRLPGLVALPRAPASSALELLTAVGRRRADPDVGTYSLLTIPASVAATGQEQRIDPRLRPLGAAIRLDGPLVADGSGGPIVDRAGALVALAQVGSAAAGLPWSTVKSRLDELRPGPQQLYVGWRDQYRCSGRLHAYAAAEHPGFRPRHARLNAPVPTTRLPGTEGLDG
jgi:S1-C subfamily serine protease